MAPIESMSVPSLTRRRVPGSCEAATPLPQQPKRPLPGMTLSSVRSKGTQEVSEPESLKQGPESENELPEQGLTLSSENGLPGFSAEIVAQHDQPHDCWMIIEGKVYDVTEWVPKHPGGSLIHVRAGGECTQLFESYHPLYVRKLLEKYLIGRLAIPQPGSKGADSPSSLAFLPDTGFYRTVKQRVEAHFKARKVNPRVHPHMYLKAALILLGYALGFHATYFAPWGFAWALLSAVVLGVFAAEIGVSIQHDGNHGAFSTSPTLGLLMGLSMDLIGASSFYWKQQHVVGHHIHTNVLGFDPDVRVMSPDMRRVVPHQPWSWCHAYQHIYWMFLYSLIAIKSTLVDDFCTYSSGMFGPMKVGRMAPHEELAFWGSKVFYFGYMFGLPAAFGTRTLAQYIILYLTAQLSAGFVLAFLFQVNHAVPGSEFPEAAVDPGQGSPSVHREWAAFQVVTSANFSPGNVFWNHLSGGLSHQIEHHLFPGLCHVYYPEIQPIVESTCKEFGISYNSYPTFWAALKAHFRHLRILGAQDYVSMSAAHE